MPNCTSCKCFKRDGHLIMLLLCYSYGGPISREKCRSPCDDVDIMDDDVNAMVHTKTLDHVIISLGYWKSVNVLKVGAPPTMNV